MNLSVNFENVIKSDIPVRNEVAALAWSEGMQLLPQHFQYLDLRQESMMKRYALASCPYHWGLDLLELDLSALSGGKVVVLGMSGQFTDGLAFEYRHTQHGVLEYDFGSLEVDFPLRLAVAVASEDFNSQFGSVKRFSLNASAPIADSLNPEEKASIIRLQPKLLIQILNSRHKEYLQIPFIEIEKNAQGFEGTIYHPPAIRIISQSALDKLIHEVAVGIRRAATLLQGYAVPNSLPTNYTNGHGWILSLLTSGLSLLEGQMNSRVSHPYDLYLTLCNIAGNTSAILGKVPPYFPGYDHKDPAYAITALCNFIAQSLPSITPKVEPVREVKLTRGNELGVWVLPSNEIQGLKNAVFMMNFKHMNGVASVKEWIDSALICDVTEADHCHELRVKGLPRLSVDSIASLELSANSEQQLLIVDGLETIKVSSALTIEFKQEAAKVAIASVSLMLPNQ